MEGSALATVRSPNRSWGWLIWGLAGGLGLLGGIFIWLGRNGTEVMSGVVLLAGAVIALLAGRKMVVAITVTRDAIELQPVLGPARIVPRNRLERGVLLDRYARLGVPIGACLILLSRRDRPVLRTAATVFHQAQLEKVATALAPLPITRHPKLMTPALLAEQDPDLATVPLWERRPWLFAWLVTGALILLLTPAILLLDAL